MPLIEPGDQTVPVIVQARSYLPPADAFEFITPIDLPKVFVALGPIPGVREVAYQTGAWDHVGAERSPQLTDGSQVNERLTQYDRGHSFAYELTGFTNVFRHFLQGVRGEWTFTPDGAGTVIRWTYEFKPRTRTHRVRVQVGIAPLWRRYMRAALRRAISLLESAGPS